MRDERPGAWWGGKTDKTVKQGEKNHLWPHIHAWTHTHKHNPPTTPREASHASIYLEKENLPLLKDTSCPLPQVLLGIHLISYFKLQCGQCIRSGGITQQNTCHKKSTLFNSWAYGGEHRDGPYCQRGRLFGGRDLCVTWAMLPLFLTPGNSELHRYSRGELKNTATKKTAHFSLQWIVWSLLKGDGLGQGMAWYPSFPSLGCFTQSNKCNMVLTLDIKF